MTVLNPSLSILSRATQHIPSSAWSTSVPQVPCGEEDTGKARDVGPAEYGFLPGASSEQQYKDGRQAVFLP